MPVAVYDSYSSQSFTDGKGLDVDDSSVNRLRTLVLTQFRRARGVLPWDTVRSSTFPT